MSNLRTDNLSPLTGGGGSIPMLTAIQGTAKAWSNLNGTGVIAPRDDFNVSSYTDNGVGDYTITFSTARPNANYAPSGFAFDNTNTIGRGFVSNSPVSGLPTTTSFRFSAVSPGVGNNDYPLIGASILGDPH